MNELLTVGSLYNKDNSIQHIFGGINMPMIAPVSELRNYEQIPEKVKPNAPAYLTKNGHGQFSVHNIEDDEEFEKTRAMVKLLTEINKGILQEYYSPEARAIPEKQIYSAHDRTEY